jgi:hypothetical protein
MSLNRFTPALLAACTRDIQSNAPPVPSQDSTTASTHTFLIPLLRTLRAISQKYRTRLARVLAEEEVDDDGSEAGGGEGVEHEMMWFALKYDKGEEEEEGAGDEAAADERWRKGVLDRMEKRELVGISLPPGAWLG